MENTINAALVSHPDYKYGYKSKKDIYKNNIKK